MALNAPRLERRISSTRRPSTRSKPKYRNIGNLALLDLAARLGLIAPELARPAAEAYRSLRRLQHRLGLQEQKNALVNPQETTHQTAAVMALWNAVFGNTDAALP